LSFAWADRQKPVAPIWLVYLWSRVEAPLERADQTAI